MTERPNTPPPPPAPGREAPPDDQSSPAATDAAIEAAIDRELTGMRRGTNIDRLVFFSDAVFAIAMTLLVLELKLPEMAHATPAEVNEAIVSLALPFIGYLVSFVVIASAWHAHHDRFAFVRGYDSTLVMLNVLLLLFVAFLPMPTSLLFAVPVAAASLPQTLYALTIAGAFTMLSVEWIYARRKGLLDPTLSPAAHARVTWSLVPTIAMFLLSIPVSFLVGPQAAFWCWALIAVVAPMQSILVRRRFRATERRRLHELAAANGGRLPAPVEPAAE